MVYWWRDEGNSGCVGCEFGGCGFEGCDEHEDWAGAGAADDGVEVLGAEVLVLTVLEEGGAIGVADGAGAVEMVASAHKIAGVVDCVESASPKSRSS